MTSEVLSANGVAHASPGQRPRHAALFHQALKKRSNRCFALSGLGMFYAIEPRALPRAGISRPFGAGRAISTMEVIEERIKLAKDHDAATKRGEAMGLSADEIAFYDSLTANDSAVTAMGVAKLKVSAAELIVIGRVKNAEPCAV